MMLLCIRGIVIIFYVEDLYKVFVWRDNVNVYPCVSKPVLFIVDRAYFMNKCWM